MLVTTGEEASWSTKRWAPRIMNEGHIYPMSPQEMGSMKSISSCPKGQALDTPSRQPEAGKVRQEPTRIEYVWKPQRRFIRLILTTQPRGVFCLYWAGTGCPHQVLAADEICFSVELPASAQTLLNTRRPQHEHKSHNFLAAAAPGSVVADMVWSWSDVFILGIGLPKVFCFSSSHT